jgi:hypothetical protein
MILWTTLGSRLTRRSTPMCLCLCRAKVGAQEGRPREEHLRHVDRPDQVDAGKAKNGGEEYEQYQNDQENGNAKFLDFFHEFHVLPSFFMPPPVSAVQADTPVMAERPATGRRPAMIGKGRGPAEKLPGPRRPDG